MSILTQVILECDKCGKQCPSLAYVDVEKDYHTGRYPVTYDLVKEQEQWEIRGCFPTSMVYCPDCKDSVIYSDDE